MNFFALAGDETIDNQGNLKTHFIIVDAGQLFAAKDPILLFTAVQENIQVASLHPI